jgi:hypothetical protein
LIVKSNQGVCAIKLSNLCAEIIERCFPDETAGSNLASLALPIYAKAWQT